MGYEHLPATRRLGGWAWGWGLRGSLTFDSPLLLLRIGMSRLFDLCSGPSALGSVPMDQQASTYTRKRNMNGIVWQTCVCEIHHFSVAVSGSRIHPNMCNTGVAIGQCWSAEMDDPGGTARPGAAVSLCACLSSASQDFHIEISHLPIMQPLRWS